MKCAAILNTLFFNLLGGAALWKIPKLYQGYVKIRNCVPIRGVSFGVEGIYSLYSCG